MVVVMYDLIWHVDRRVSCLDHGFGRCYCTGNDDVFHESIPRNARCR